MLGWECGTFRVVVGCQFAHAPSYESDAQKTAVNSKGSPGAPLARHRFTGAALGTPLDPRLGEPLPRIGDLLAALAGGDQFRGGGSGVGEPLDEPHDRLVARAE